MDWLSISPRSGRLNETAYQQRLEVSVGWDNVPEGFNDTLEVGITSTPSQYPYFDVIRIPVMHRKVPSGFTSFPESAGYISMEAQHYQRSSSSKTSIGETLAFSHIPYLGTRTESGSVALRPFFVSRSSLNASTSTWKRLWWILGVD